MPQAWRHHGRHRRLSPRAQRCFELAAIAAFVVLWLGLARTTATALPGSATALAALLSALLLGLAAADLVSGLVHFTCDAFFDEGTRWIGPAFIAPFRDHHRDPQGIARHGFCERNGNNCAATAPLLASALAIPGALDAPVGAFVLAATAALAATNQIHAWAHAEQRPPAVAWLQRSGLLLPPAAHAAHHAHAHDRAYCITTGWLNPWLDRHRVFARLERLVRSLGDARDAG